MGSGGIPARPPGSVLLVHGPSTGGIGRHVETLAAALTARGWDVRVAAVSAGPRAWWALRRLAADVDVVHAHGLRVGWLASVLPSRVLHRRRPALVVTVHNVVLDDVAGRTAPVLRRLERALPGRVDAVIATSPAVAEQVGAAATVVRPVGPEPAPSRSAAEVRAAHGVAEDAPLVVVVGRLHPQKGLDVLLDAAPAIVARVPGTRILIVGSGPLEAHLRERVVAGGPGGPVRLAGASTDAAGELAAADVVAVPSVWESGPLVVTEAMELGRPVVATPVGFVPELVVDGATGRLVPIGDAPALAAAVGDLLERPDEARALGCAGRVKVRAWLDRDGAVDAVVAVYDAARP